MYTHFTYDCNPHRCMCGWHGDAERQCTCTPSAVARYQKRVSGPLMDRIDIHIEIPRVNYEKLSSERVNERSASIRERVIGARTRQAERFAGSRCLPNADMGPAEIRSHCQLDAAGQSLMKAAMCQSQLSARGYHHMLKPARTITHLAGQAQISVALGAEAIQHRLRRTE